MSERRQYRCDNEQCGVTRMSACGLAIYGTCKECGTGCMRREGARQPPAGPSVPATDQMGAASADAQQEGNAVVVRRSDGAPLPTAGNPASPFFTSDPPTAGPPAVPALPSGARPPLEDKIHTDSERLIASTPVRAADAASPPTPSVSAEDRARNFVRIFLSDDPATSWPLDLSVEEITRALRESHRAAEAARDAQWREALRESLGVGAYLALQTSDHRSHAALRTLLGSGAPAPTAPALPPPDAGAATGEELDRLERLLSERTAGVWKLWGMDVVADQDGTGNQETAKLVARTFDPDRPQMRTFDASLICDLVRLAPALIACARAVLAADRATAPSDVLAGIRRLLADGYGPGGGYYEPDQRVPALLSLLDCGWGHGGLVTAQWLQGIESQMRGALHTMQGPVSDLEKRCHSDRPHNHDHLSALRYALRSLTGIHEKILGVLSSPFPVECSGFVRLAEYATACGRRLARPGGETEHPMYCGRTEAEHAPQPHAKEG